MRDEKKKSAKWLTSIHDWNDLALDELAKFTFNVRQITPEIFDKKRTLEMEKRIINFRSQLASSSVVVCRRNEKMLGWASFDTASTSIIEIGRWLPIIHPDNSWEEIASSLIDQIKDHCRKISYPRIEVSFSISDDQDIRAYNLYKALYEANEMPMKDEIVYMQKNLSESDMTYINFPATYETKSITKMPDDELYNCYYEAFIQGKDRMFLDQTEKERRDYFDDYYSRSKPFITKASMVLVRKDNQEIVGVSLLRPRDDDAHLALLAIHPKYQGKKLGKLMMRLVMKRVFNDKFQTISLGVDKENLPALQLYLKLGFETKSRIVTHCWKTNQELSDIT